MPQRIATMSEDNARLELLALLVVHGSKPPTRTVVRKALTPLLSHRHGENEARKLIDAALDACLAAGAVEVQGRTSLRLAREGERRLEAEFGKVGKASWPQLRDQLLVPHAAVHDGRGAQSELKSYAALRNFLALNAVGLEYRPRITAPATLNRIVAKVVGASRSDKDAVKTALIRTWLSQTRPEQVDLDRFARDVQAAAKQATSGRWGDEKVFINHVWRQLRAEAKAGALDLQTFKERLLEANRHGLIRLSRADLVIAMPADDVRESEIATFGDTFHFINT
jgi:hypothetical protein